MEKSVILMKGYLNICFHLNCLHSEDFESFSVQIQLNEVLTQKYFDFLPGVLFTLF